MPRAGVRKLRIATPLHLFLWSMERLILNFFHGSSLCPKGQQEKEQDQKTKFHLQSKMWKSQ